MEKQMNIKKLNINFDLVINFVKNIHKLFIDLLSFNKNFIFITDKSSSLFSVNNGILSPEIIDIKKVKKALIADSSIELKVIKIPVVSNTLLKNIIINTVKKHSTLQITEKNIDYKILDKENHQYRILVFIKNFEISDEQRNTKFYTIYHILNNLINDNSFEPDSNFLIKNGNTCFLYTFKDRIFTKRDIYYSEDIKSLKKRNIYLLDLFKDADEESINEFDTIPEDKKEFALLSLKKNIFAKKQIFTPRMIALISFSCIILILVIFFEISNINREIQKNKISEQIGKLKIMYAKEKAKRGKYNEEFSQYVKIISKKSTAMNFFKSLYRTGKDNITISTVDYSDKKFTIKGICKNDSRLEDAFRDLSTWRNIDFSFDKRNNKIYFTITGQFIDE